MGRKIGMENFPRSITSRTLVQAMGRISDHKQVILGHAELADIFGVSKSTICNWRSRYSFIPTPLGVLAQGPVWYRDQISDLISRLSNPFRDAAE